MSTATGPVTLAAIQAAQELLRGVSRVTPVEGARFLTDKVGGPVYMKCENLQRAGSFKIRGAYVRLAKLGAEERARGVVAASAGNHAQGVALAASLIGLKSTVFMPVGAPLPKIAATESYGADIRFHGHYVDEALVAAREFADSTGAVFIHPFDHPDIVTGQGTVGLEVLEQCPDARTIIVPVGGGGLVAGIAVAVKALHPATRVVGVQAERAAAYPASLAAGHPVALPGMATMADGIALAKPGDVPFALVQEYVDDVVTVSEESLSRALLLCLERGKLVVEPAGVAAIAAVLDEPQVFEPPVAIVLSGGNIDPLLLLRVLRHGMAAAGRYLSFRLRIPDRPGALARLLSELATADANILEIEHLRTNPRLQIDEVEVAIQIEARGPRHCDDVLSRLRGVGYTLLFS